MACKGGIISYSGDYTLHTFNSSGTFTVSDSGKVDVLLVGAGGMSQGFGGGGGGQVLEYFNQSVTKGNVITVTVNPVANFSSGTAVYFGSLVAQPGSNSGNGSTNLAGASSGNGYSGGVGASEQKSDGTYCYGGGGGGAGGAGSAASLSSGGAGGPGKLSTITGIYYGGGGGGGASEVGGLGQGSGGIGGGAPGGYSWHCGAANTGGGGGGGPSASGGYSGWGGSGVVVVRYLTANFPTNLDPVYSGPSAPIIFQ